MSAGRARHPRDAALGEQARGADSVLGGQASGATTDHHMPTRPGRSAIRTRPASYRAIRSAGPAGAGPRAVSGASGLNEVEKIVPRWECGVSQNHSASRASIPRELRLSLRITCAMPQVGRRWATAGLTELPWRHHFRSAISATSRLVNPASRRRSYAAATSSGTGCSIINPCCG